MFQDDILVGNELRQAAFRAYASLGANDEDIRKKVCSLRLAIINVFTMYLNLLEVRMTLLAHCHRYKLASFGSKLPCSCHCVLNPS